MIDFTDFVPEHKKFVDQIDELDIIQALLNDGFIPQSATNAAQAAIDERYGTRMRGSNKTIPTTTGFLGLAPTNVFKSKISMDEYGWHHYNHCTKGAVFFYVEVAKIVSDRNLVSFASSSEDVRKVYAPMVNKLRRHARKANTALATFEETYLETANGRADDLHRLYKLFTPALKACVGQSGYDCTEHIDSTYMELLLWTKGSSYSSEVPLIAKFGVSLYPIVTDNEGLAFFEYSMVVECPELREKIGDMRETQEFKAAIVRFNDTVHELRQDKLQGILAGEI